MVHHTEQPKGPASSVRPAWTQTFPLQHAAVCIPDVCPLLVSLLYSNVSFGRIAVLSFDSDTLWL